MAKIEVNYGQPLGEVAAQPEPVLRARLDDIDAYLTALAARRAREDRAMGAMDLGVADRLLDERNIIDAKLAVTSTGIFAGPD